MSGICKNCGKSLESNEAEESHGGNCPAMDQEPKEKTREERMKEMAVRFLEKRTAIYELVKNYFPNKMIVLDEMYKDNKLLELYMELNKIWFNLPDNVNIFTSEVFRNLIYIVEE
jgi:hypothetical protein